MTKASIEAADELMRLFQKATRFGGWSSPEERGEYLKACDVFLESFRPTPQSLTAPRL